MPEAPILGSCLTSRPEDIDDEGRKLDGSEMTVLEQGFRKWVSLKCIKRPIYGRLGVLSTHLASFPRGYSFVLLQFSIIRPDNLSKLPVQ